MKRITFDVSDELHSAFKSTAAQYGLTISDYARAMLFQFPDILEIRKNESCAKPVQDEKSNEHPGCC